MGTDSSSRTLLGWWLKQKLGFGRSLVRAWKKAFRLSLSISGKPSDDATKENCQILLTATEDIVG